MTRRTAALVACLALLLTVGGCVTLPTSGPVKAGPVEQEVGDQAQLDFTPSGPRAGAAPADIVTGFLTAMTANPLNTSVARQYLTDDSSRTWVPEKRTVVYGGKDISAEASGATLALHDVSELDGRGKWLGDPTRGAGFDWRLRLVKQRGQWRISDPPNALVIPRSDFDDRFTQHFLYFFDTTSQLLVPEPVYVPRGAQAPTMLVSGLLDGPERGLLGVERSHIPAGTRLDDLSVPVSRDGTAEVPLSDEVLNLDHNELSLAFAQLAWTLAQIPGIERMRVTVGGSPLELPGEGSDVRVDRWSDLDPAGAWASHSLFGLRGRQVVSVLDGRERRVTGVFAPGDPALRSIAVDFAAEHIAGVSADGSRVLVAARPDAPAAVPGADRAATVYRGVDVLRPAYDVYGQLWLVDRTATGARVEVVHDGAAREVAAPGLTGANVVAMALSRDGTRLLAEVRGGTRDQLLLSRVVRDASGLVRGLTRARRLDLDPSVGRRVRGLGWRTPGTLALLTTANPGASKVVVVNTDGSLVPGDPASDAEAFRGRALGLVTAPTVGAPLYVRNGSGNLFQLATTGRWTGSGVDPSLVAPTFVG